MKYWRSLDHLAETPEFREFLEREFPAGASEMVADPVTRRNFVKIMSASLALAGFGLTGCRRPEEKILPFGQQPENYTHGVPKFYATAMPARGSALPLLVRSHEGRPIKVEGNPDHPDSNGATDLFAQASILNLYDPDRTQRFTQNGNTVSREAALDFLAKLGQEAAGNKGQGLCFLMERSSSPSRHRLQQAISQKLPNARWFVYEPVDLYADALALEAATGKVLRPYYKLDQAKVILSLDCDFVGAESDTQIHCRNFARGRRVTKPGDNMNRLYAVEGVMSLTGTNADHRLRVATSAVQAVASAIASAVGTQGGQGQLPTNVSQKWIAECAADLAANKGASLVMAGHRQPAAVHALAHAMNAALGNVGKTVLYYEGLPNQGGTIQELGKRQVQTLVILGGNPAYNAPIELKAKRVVRLGYFEDETFAASTWHLPLAHYLESWGDARTADGTLVPIQPLVAPLFGGLTEIEVLARIAGIQMSPYEFVRETFMGIAGKDEEKWKKFLHDGYLKDSAAKPVNAEVKKIDGSAGRLAQPGRENLEVVFMRDYRLDDGRNSNNGWLQEMPDPITKTVWDGLVLISRKTAEELGVKNQDVVEIELGGRKVRGPIWIQPGFADYSLGLQYGYGRKKTGRVGQGVGLYNAYELKTAEMGHFAVGAKLRKTGETYTVASTQEHGSMEGRPIIREGTLEQFRKEPNFAKNMDLEAHMEHVKKDPKTGLPYMIYEHPYRAKEERGKQVGVKLPKFFKSEIHQWGMSIDLSACVGCGTCVLACQSENNVPIVGKDQVRRNREMHWLRIDRYYSGAADKAPKEQIDDPQVVNQPMFCQHCENAPCESVCPVNATVHDEEGLNLMAYNRCVGTRYCSNNCPYKVRKFNYFDYIKRPLNGLYKSPLASTHEGKYEFFRWFKDPWGTTRPEDEWELLKLARNPDVTVRMRGVMEKCTFCVQRIEGAKIAQKIKAGQSGDVQVPEGTFTTACAQACPAEAIVFGNLADPNSRVSQLKKQERDYSVLGFLDTRPRLTYLARIRNPNPKMPDYYEVPLNIKEYHDKQSHGAHEGDHAAEATGKSHGAGKETH
jgi:MoCo/4Fe-4S cofactor protein with predicted Tat translocation signal